MLSTRELPRVDNTLALELPEPRPGLYPEL